MIKQLLMSKIIKSFLQYTDTHAH